MELENVIRELLKCYSFILERMVQIEENPQNRERILTDGKSPYLVDLWSERRKIYDPAKFEYADLSDITSGRIAPEKKEAFLEIYREMINILVAGQMMAEDIQNRREVDIYSNILSYRWEYDEMLKKNGIPHSFGFPPIFSRVYEEQEGSEYDDDDDYHDKWWEDYWNEQYWNEHDERDATKTGVDTKQNTTDSSEPPASKQLTVDPDGIVLVGRQSSIYNEILLGFRVNRQGETSETTEFWQNCFEQISLQHSNAFEIFKAYAKLLIARSNDMAKNTTQISEVINYTIYDELFKSLLQRIKALEISISSYVKMYNIDLSLENEASRFMQKLENADRSHVFVYYIPGNIGEDGANTSSNTSNDVIAIFDDKSYGEEPVDLLPYHVFLEQGGDLRAIDYIAHPRRQKIITSNINTLYKKIDFKNLEKVTDRDIDLLKCSLVNDAIMFLHQNYAEGTDDINKLAQIYLGSTYSYLAPLVIERFFRRAEKEDSQENLIDRIREIESTRIRTKYNKINSNSFWEGNFPRSFIKGIDLSPIVLTKKLLEYYEKGHLERHRKGLEQRRTEKIKGMRNLQEDEICIDADNSKTPDTIAREVFMKYMQDMKNGALQAEALTQSEINGYPRQGEEPLVVSTESTYRLERREYEIDGKIYLIEGEFTFKDGTVSGPNASLPQIKNIDVEVLNDNYITIARISKSNLPPSTKYSSKTKKYMLDQNGRPQYLIKENPGMSSNVLTTDSEGFQFFSDGLISPDDIAAFKEYIERNIQFKPVEKCSKGCGSKFDVKFGTELQRTGNNTPQHFEDSVGPARVADVIKNWTLDLPTKQLEAYNGKIEPNE